MFDDDLGNILEALGLGLRKGRGALVEFGAEVRVDGRPCRLAVSGDGSIIAAMWPRKLVLLQPRGIGARLELSWEELKAALPVVRYWKAHREDLVFLGSSSSGFPAGRGGAWYYQPPGKGAERVMIGRQSMGHHRGRSFTGGKERRLLKRPRTVAPGVCVTAEAWHAGETAVEVPFEGVLVGETYRVSSDLELCGDRDRATLLRCSYAPGAVEDLGTFDEFTASWKREHGGRRPGGKEVFGFIRQHRDNCERLANEGGHVRLHPFDGEILSKLLKCRKRNKR